MQGCGTRGWYKELVPGFGKCPRVWYKGLVQGFGTRVWYEFGTRDWDKRWIGSRYNGLAGWHRTG